MTSQASFSSHSQNSKNSMPKIYYIMAPVLASGIIALLWTPTNTDIPNQRYIKPRITPPWVSKITSAHKSKRSNVLLVVYDARRRDDFSFGPYGNKRGDTPFLSEFKDDAVFFEDAISPGCWTIPVHASIFSGFSIGELGNDLYNPGYSIFPSEFLSLAEIFSFAGYHTIAYADHPYFYNQYNPADDLSLMRGFQQFNVIGDFTHGYASHSNISTQDNLVHHRRTLTGFNDMTLDELTNLVDQFNRGELHFDLATESDYDPVNKLHLAKLYEMYKKSAYFKKRYGNEFDHDVFTNDDTRPFFLFLNLHMCTIARPAPKLWSQWLLKTVMLNAQASGAKLVIDPEKRSAYTNIKNMFTKLDLRISFPHQSKKMSWILPVKQVFDNRFYDANFRAIWEYLSHRGLTKNLTTIVLSDHGLSFSEHGETFYLHGGARPFEDLVRVPLVIRFPQQSKLRNLHGVYNEKVNLIDLFQTMVDIGVGLGVFQRSLPIRGKSLISRLVNHDYEQTLFSESSLRPDSYHTLPQVSGRCTAVYHNDLKLIYAEQLYRPGIEWKHEHGFTDEQKISESLSLLYNLKNDPSELHDLSNQSPDSVDALAEFIKTSPPISLQSAQKELWDDKALDTLKSLGYIR